MSGPDDSPCPQLASAPQRFEPGPLLADASAWDQTPFFKWMGMRVLDAEAGRGRLVLDVQDHHRGGGGTVAARLVSAAVGLLSALELLSLYGLEADFKEQRRRRRLEKQTE